MLIDEKGKIFGKLSILDLIIVLLIIGLAATFLYRGTHKNTALLINSDNEFYVTFIVEKIRDYSVEAINTGDIFYEQHAQLLGETVDCYSKQATEIMRKDDGTATIGILEERYDLYIVLKCKGNITQNGYYINGNKQVSIGDSLRLKSNMAVPSGRIYDISDTKPTR